MKISAAYENSRFGLSFELFPPKTDDGLTALYRHVEALTRHQPAYFTCTYGAGGSTQGQTLEIVRSVKERFGLPVASHLTCVGATQNDLHRYLQQAAELLVDGIVALRGDPPQGQKTFTAVEGGFLYANQLVSMIRQDYPQFDVAVAGYPEKHQEAPSFDVDLANLKRKVDAGADVVITQLFYDNADFFRFHDQCGKVGLDIPVVPGLLPVTNLGQIQRITSLCGAKLPADFVAKLSENDAADWQFQVGIEFATAQVQQLIDHGVPGIHFYVLNKSQATCQVLDAVRLPR